MNSIDPKSSSVFISACLIVKNEEAALPYCLESIRKVANEIIVVDTGSTDRTVEIAGQLGAKVFHYDWADDFSAARNHALNQAVGEWILMVDADDLLPEKSAHEIPELLKSLSESVGAVIVSYVYAPTKDGRNPLIARRPSLIRGNNPHVRFEGRVHEQITPSVKRAGLLTQESNLVLIHNQQDTLAEKDSKKHFYTQLLKREIKDRPDDVSALFHLGANSPEGDSIRAEYLTRYLALAQSQDWVRIAKAYALLIGIYGRQGDAIKARKVIAESLALYPGHAELLYETGLYFQKAGMPERAEASYTQLVTSQYSAFPDLCNPLILSFWRYYRLAEVCFSQGKLIEARDILRLALKNHSNGISAWALLARVLHGLRDGEGAEASLVSLAQYDHRQAETIRLELAEARHRS